MLLNEDWQVSKTLKHYKTLHLPYFESAFQSTLRDHSGGDKRKCCFQCLQSYYSESHEIFLTVFFVMLEFSSTNSVTLKVLHYHEFYYN